MTAFNGWTSLLLAACCFQLASAGPLQLTRDTDLATGHYRLELEFDAPLTEEIEVAGRQFQMPMIEGEGFIGRPGAPDLPAAIRLLEMPDHSDIQLRFIEGDSHVVEAFDAYPCQDRVSQDNEFPLPWIEEEAIYNQDAWWPAQAWEVGDPALMRNTRIAKTSFFPIQVNPVQGTARIWTRMVFDLSFEGENPVNAKTYDIQDDRSPLSRQLLDRVVRPREADGAIRDTWFDEGDLPGKYLVFANTTAQASSYFQNLMDWKRKRGHEVVVLGQNDVSFSSSAIRSRILSEYQGPGSVDYVLLVGDTDGTYAVPTSSSQYDHYYAMLEGGDILGDVAVGRLSVDTASQLAAVCEKIQNYESSPYMTDPQWLRRAGFTVGSTVCGMSMKTLSRGIAAEFVTRRGYTEIDTAFCEGSSHVINWFTSGISFYTYRGWVGMEGLSQTAVQNMAQGPRTPVATIFTCGTGDFNGGDDYTERFLMAGSPGASGGAVAAVGFATLSTHTRYNNVFCGGYYASLLEHDVPEIGACLLQGKYELYATLPPSEQSNAENFAYWGNLMGDPGTVQWAGVPAPLNASIDSSLPLGTDHIELVCTSSGAPAEGIKVCAWQDQSSDLQVVGLTDAAGRVVLPLSGLEPGTLHVTATHHRYVPLLLTSSISAQSADAVVSAFNLPAGDLLPGDPGQALSFTLENTGSTTLTGITITPQLDAVYGSLAAPALTLGSLAPGSQHVFSGITIDPVGDLSDGELVPVMLELGSNQGSLTRMVQLPVGAPLLGTTSFSFIGGILDPGNSDTARIGVNNAGSVGGSDVSISFVSERPQWLEVEAGSFPLGTLASGATVALDVDFSALPGANPGQQVNVLANWTSHGGEVSGSFGFVVSIGSQVVTDPTGPDAYGYWAYENLDGAYPSAPTYNWFAISAPEGGPGTELAIEDTSEDDDTGAWVDLPFTFSYYGQAYNSMMVCTNGFVSFAEDGFGEWDFRNHVFPSAMGPDAMIAPMWDDHITTGPDRGIWYWHDTVNQTFVVTWYDLLAYQSGGPNTFQLVLYDPATYVTATGDGPFMFQYQDFNDTQSHNTDFNYCSIGFKDHDSLQGMTLLHWTQEASTIHPVTDGRAIYISTEPGDFVDTIPPQIAAVPVNAPFASQAFDLRASISDFSGLSVAEASWRVDGGAWTTSDLTGLGGGAYSLTIAGLPGGSVVEYYFHAVDASEYENASTSSTYALTVSNAMLIFSDDFNDGSGFTHVAGGGLTDEWHLESANAWEGGQCWKFGGAGTGDYGNNAGGVLTSPMINLPLDATDLDIRYYSWIEAETSGAYPDSCYDAGVVEWSIDGGPWEQVEPESGYTHALRSSSSLTSWFGFPRNVLSGSSAWSLESISVPDGSSSVRLRYLFGSDGGVTREGWYLDEFMVAGIVPEQVLTPVVIDEASVLDGFIVLQWEASPLATSYKVYSSSDPYPTSWTLEQTVTSTSAQVLRSGSRRFFMVRAVN